MSDNKVTLDQLDNSAVEAMTMSVGDVSMLNTENKTIVGALAEIVGKKEIANAIGEPLAETDKFTEMSSEINGLLSTFKTNMMNAGVVVESGDKFKQLIDKIQGLTEGEGNKGIRYAMGEQAVEGLNTYDLDFTPDYIFVEVTGSQTVYAWQSNYLVSNLNTAGFSYRQSGSVLRNTQISITDISNTSFNISISDKEKVNFGAWYAIGIGEEDTTLRDSLASILEEKGVDVTEEDDMASLISKVSLLDKYVPTIVEIYKEGIEFLPIVEGYTARPNDGSSKGSQNKEDDYLNIYVKGQCKLSYRTENKVDLSNFDRICIEWEKISPHTQPTCYLQIFNTDPETFTAETQLYYKKSAGFDRRVNTMDIRAIDGEYYIQTVAGYAENVTGECTLKIYRIWLERDALV